MKFVERIAELSASVSAWPGWRRYGPAAGSIATHVVLLAAVASMLGAVGKSPPERPRLPSPSLEVTLVAETPPPRSVRAPLEPPRVLPRAQPDAEAPPAAEPRKDQKLREAASQQLAATAEPSDDGVYLGASPPGAPLGLRSLLESDPCKFANGLKNKDCGMRWSEKIPQGDALRLASKEELRQLYGEFMPVCPHWVGCEPHEWISTNGTRSFGGTSPMASGAGGLQGIHDLVGRLPQKPDFVDRGFGD